MGSEYAQFELEAGLVVAPAYIPLDPEVVAAAELACSRLVEALAWTSLAWNRMESARVCKTQESKSVGLSNCMDLNRSSAAHILTLLESM